MQQLLVLFFRIQRELHAIVGRLIKLLHDRLVRLQVFLEVRIIENVNFAKFGGEDVGDTLKGNAAVKSAAQ